MPMYIRHTSKYQQTKERSAERNAFEESIVNEFSVLLKNSTAHNIKVERAAFAEILNDIGCLLQKFSEHVVKNPEEFPAIHTLLNKHPVPEVAATHLPLHYRVFCLALNALKQWQSAEQSATDRVLLGGEYKRKLQKHVTHCLITGELLDYRSKGKVHYHHTLRDGRFPIPLSEEGHAILEGQVKGANSKIPAASNLGRT